MWDCALEPQFSLKGHVVGLLFWVLSGDGVEFSWAFSAADQCQVQWAFSSADQRQVQRLCTRPAAAISDGMSCLSCPQPVVELQFWDHPFLNRDSGLKTRKGLWHSYTWASEAKQHKRKKKKKVRVILSPDSMFISQELLKWALLVTQFLWRWDYSIW